MCEFCEKIYNSRTEVRNAIAEDETMSEGIYIENDNYRIYVGDSFGEQYGVLYGIKYCPYCGKKLDSVTKRSIMWKKRITILVFSLIFASSLLLNAMFYCDFVLGW